MTRRDVRSSSTTSAQRRTQPSSIARPQPHRSAGSGPSAGSKCDPDTVASTGHFARNRGNHTQYSGTCSDSGSSTRWRIPADSRTGFFPSFPDLTDQDQGGNQDPGSEQAEYNPSLAAGVYDIRVSGDEINTEEEFTGLETRPIVVDTEEGTTQTGNGDGDDPLRNDLA